MRCPRCNSPDRNGPGPCDYGYLPRSSPVPRPNKFTGNPAEWRCASGHRHATEAEAVLCGRLGRALDLIDHLSELAMVVVNWHEVQDGNLDNEYGKGSIERLRVRCATIRGEARS